MIRKKFRIQKVLLQLLATAIGVLFLFPILMIVNFAFKTKKELYLDNPLFSARGSHFRQLHKCHQQAPSGYGFPEFPVLYSCQRADHGAVMYNDSMGHCKR